MDITTMMLIVAGGAMVIAIMLAIVQKVKGTHPQQQESTNPTKPAMSPMSVAKRQSEVLHGIREPSKRRRNKRGWQAPAGHYFGDDDQLYTDAGDLILEMAMVAQLCGERYYEEPEVPSAPIEEAIASRPVAAEVGASTSFSDLQTEDTTKSCGYSGGYSADDGGYDDGGDCGDCGDD